jgi:GR25 family glycosyltransferase involved in LPS biosynthesis
MNASIGAGEGVDAKANGPMKGFPPAAVINLERSPERLADVTGRFAQLGIALERLEATDAVAEPDLCASALDRASFHVFAGRDALPGEIGCALSHLRAWASLEYRAEPTLLVVEDDAIPNAALSGLPAALEALPADWDVLVLAENYSRHPWWRGKGGGIDLVRYRHPGYLAVGYVVHRRILRLKHLWTRPRPVRFPFDHWRLWSAWHGVRVYSTVQTLIDPPGGASVPISTIGRADSVPRFRGLRAVPKLAMRLPIHAMGLSRMAADRLRVGTGITTRERP